MIFFFISVAIRLDLIHIRLDHPHLARSLVEWLERLTSHAKVATVVSFDPSTPDTVESEGRQMKQCWKKHEKKYKKIHPVSDLIHLLRNLAFENSIQQIAILKI